MKFTSEEMRRYRLERPWNDDLPDEAVADLMDFHFAVLNYRIGDLGRTFRDSLPSWMQRWIR